MRSSREEGSLSAQVEIAHWLRKSQATVCSSQGQAFLEVTHNPNKMFKLKPTLNNKSLNLKSGMRSQELLQCLKSSSWRHLQPLTTSSFWILSRSLAMLASTSDQTWVTNHSWLTSWDFRSCKGAVWVLPLPVLKRSRTLRRLKSLIPIARSQSPLKQARSSPRNTLVAQSAVRIWPRKLLSSPAVTSLTTSASPSGLRSTTSAPCAAMSCPLMTKTMRGRRELQEPNSHNSEEWSLNDRLLNLPSYQNIIKYI